MGVAKKPAARRIGPPTIVKTMNFTGSKMQDINTVHRTNQMLSTAIRPSDRDGVISNMIGTAVSNQFHNASQFGFRSYKQPARRIGPPRRIDR